MHKNVSGITVFRNMSLLATNIQIQKISTRLVVHLKLFLYTTVQIIDGPSPLMALCYDLTS